MRALAAILEDSRGGVCASAYKSMTGGDASDFRIACGHRKGGNAVDGAVVKQHATCPYAYEGWNLARIKCLHYEGS